MRAKRFTLSRSQRDDLERRYKQTRERLLSDRIQAILLLDAGGCKIDCVNDASSREPV
jgi:hypothetical protein